ncbi:MAG: hypothetical protein ACE5I5_00820 [Candidatus Heimdallarchaeota archaeon]
MQDEEQKKEHEKKARTTLVSRFPPQIQTTHKTLGCAAQSRKPPLPETHKR